MPRAERSRQKTALPPGDTDPLNIDYSVHPELYRVLRGELNVFKTNPDSGNEGVVAVQGRGGGAEECRGTICEVSGV
jgi:CRP-like cAMP-binding protein